jgi:quercetin dioxygenase-like cupin family protein
MDCKQSVLISVLLALPLNILAQDATVLSNIPVSAEVINLATHPVRLDQKLGVATAKLGAGKLYQTDLTLVEIPPGGSVPPHRHLVEEMIYIVAGEGHTTMWVRSGERPHRYDWKAGDLVSPSLNAWHQHFNASDDKPARYVSVTTTPLVMNMFHDEEFLTSSDFVFEDHWRKGISQQAEYTVPDNVDGRDNIDMRSGHILPGLPDRRLKQRRESDLGITTRPNGDMAGNQILEIGVREYRDMERHPSRYPRETIVYVLAGQGSTVLKRGDEPARLVNWQAGDLFIVEANEDFDNGSRLGSVLGAPYPRILMLKPAGYFIGIGNIVPGSNQYSNQ